MPYAGSVATCPSCGTATKRLLQDTYCPRDCDRPGARSPNAVQASNGLQATAYIAMVYKHSNATLGRSMNSDIFRWFPNRDAVVAYYGPTSKQFTIVGVIGVGPGNYNSGDVGTKPSLEFTVVSVEHYTS